MLVNWFHYQPPSASCVQGSNLNWSLHLSWWIANLQTSPSRGFSRKGAPPPPGARAVLLWQRPWLFRHLYLSGVGSGEDFMVSTWWMEPCQSFPRSPAENSWFSSQTLLSVATSGFILWHPAGHLANSAPVFIPHSLWYRPSLSSCPSPETNSNRHISGPHIWTTWWESGKASLARKGGKLVRRKPKDGVSRVLEERRLLSAFWENQAKSWKGTERQWSLWKSP